MDEPSKPIAPKPAEPESPSAPPMGATLHSMRADADAVLRQTPTKTPPQNPESVPLPHQKWRRVLFFAGICTGLLIIIAGTFFFFPSLFPFLAPAPLPKPPPAPQTPPLLFTTDSSEDILFNTAGSSSFSDAIRGLLSRKNTPSSITALRITVRDGPAERYATLGDFFAASGIRPPQDILLSLGADLPMFFITSNASSSHFGFAIKTKDSERVFAAMLEWEPSIPVAFAPFFTRSGTTSLQYSFARHAFKNIDWRSIPVFQEGGESVGYMVFPAENLLVVTTSSEGIENIIARLFAAH